MALRWLMAVKSVRGLTMNQRCVLYVLADYADDAGRCWPSLETLAVNVEIHRVNVCKILGSLKQLGLIERDGRGFQLLFAALSEEKEAAAPVSNIAKPPDPEVSNIANPPPKQVSNIANRKLAISLTPSEPARNQPLSEGGGGNSAPAAPSRLDESVARLLKAAGLRTPVDQLTPYQLTEFGSFPALHDSEAVQALEDYLPVYVGRRASRTKRAYTAKFLAEDLGNGLLEEALQAGANGSGFGGAKPTGRIVRR